MKKILALLVLLLLPTLALAEGGLSDDAGRSKDTGNGSFVKDDSSISVDKSEGGRKTKSKSSERATESSTSSSKSSKTSTNSESSGGQSVELNINSILVREFVKHYENIAEAKTKAEYVFATCKPITGAITEYPILNSCPQGTRFTIANQDTSDIKPASQSTRIVSNCGAQNGFQMPKRISLLLVDIHHPVVEKYAVCRIMASAWLILWLSKSQKIRSSLEDEIVERINAVF